MILIKKKLKTFFALSVIFILYATVSYAGLSKTIEVAIVKVEITPSVMSATESLNSAEFEVKVKPSSISVDSYQWLTGSANGAWPSTAGNNPALDYSSPTANKTRVDDTRWFAPTPSRRQAIDGQTCTYLINCEVDIEGTKIRSDNPASLKVSVDMTGQCSGPNFEDIDTITVANVSGVFRVTGRGTFHRSAPGPTVNMPISSQFYSKAMKHEQTHADDWVNTVPWKDLVDADKLYNDTISTLTSNVSEADLRTKIFNAVSTQYSADVVIFQTNLCDLEKRAFDAMNAVAPDFLELDDADWKPIYGCP